MKVEDLDHLGIIAGIIDHLQLEERVNQCLGTHPQQIVSPGQGVKAMILNGLGFVSAPLYLYEGFFCGKATSHLLGEGIQAEHLNDDYLGRLLDKIWEYGASHLFSLVAMDAYRQFGVKGKSYHLDSSSFSVHGDYESRAGGEGAIEITYGYSRDQRPDLKQFLVEMVCCQDGEVPLAFEIASGNEADKAVFAQRFKAFAHQWDVTGTLVADSALYSAENLAILGNLHWVTRVPMSLAEAQSLVRELPEESFQASQRQGYRYSSVCSTYGGVRQHWVVVENQQRRQQEHQQLAAKVDKAYQQAQRQLRAQGKVEFACAADARLQMQTLAQAWPYHHLVELEVEQKRHYDKPGRPKQGSKPSRCSYRATGTIVPDDDTLERERRKAGRFILASNQVESQVEAEDILNDYKEQQSPERGFRLLKDPLFFTSSVFLKTPGRIAALVTVMGLSLLVYTLAQRQLRQRLAAASATVADQRKQPTATPTFRWICQCFQAIHLVWQQGKAQISNLTPERINILGFFGAPCQKYYLLC